MAVRPCRELNSSSLCCLGKGIGEGRAAGGALFLHGQHLDLIGFIFCFFCWHAACFMSWQRERNRWQVPQRQAGEGETLQIEAGQKEEERSKEAREKGAAGFKTGGKISSAKSKPVARRGHKANGSWSTGRPGYRRSQREGKHFRRMNR